VNAVRAIVRGVGSYLPARVLSNSELARMVDTSDAWIVERTGIKRRRIAADNELTSDLALAAARAALAHAKMTSADIDLIVLATTTPDETFPATATRVQAALGITRGAAFDVQAVCTGFIYGLAVADSFIRTGQAQGVLVIGAETFSRLLDWTDRATCVLFGDGAGAAVLTPAHETGDPSDRGVLCTRLHSDGRLHDILYVDGGPSSTGRAGHVRMQGRELFRHAVTNMAEVIEETVSAVGLTPTDIDWFVPHQANQRIIDGTARKLGIPPERVVSTIAEHGNTSAASVPLALATAVADGRIKRGHLVLLEAMGGGLTWGAALIRW
jgi:3-oxoacyl-[acyl-carrier-protein] synthase-3